MKIATAVQQETIFGGSVGAENSHFRANGPHLSRLDDLGTIPLPLLA
jgi:hypothetical protein